MDRASDAARLRVSVAFSPRAGEVDVVDLLLPMGATVADALRESGMQARHPGHALENLPVGVWGEFCERSDPLRDRDRFELYRPLLVDPKDARRRRQLAQRPGKRKR